MTEERTYVGIDLGTSYCCVGVWRNNRVEIIPNDDGNRSTPSYVGFYESECLFGDAAKSLAAMNESNTVFDVLSMIGCHFQDEVVQSSLKYWSFTVLEGPGGKPKIQVVVNDEVKQFTAEEILAMLLMKMKDIAETYLGQEVTNAVVAVPTQFNMIQRQAISYACNAAGLHVERIVNQSTIAVFSHYLYRTFEIEHNVLVFDIGGGTVNVSLLTVETGVFEVKTTAGNNHLGGKDFDNQMVNYCVELLRVQYHKDIGNNQRALRRIASACERAKRTLSSSSEAHIILD
jgi:heat shock protein 1/8